MSKMPTNVQSTSVSIFAAIAYLAVTSTAQALNPPPDGAYPNFNTAEGGFSLFNLTTGIGHRSKM